MSPLTAKRLFTSRLRIAWSVICGIACVLLIVLWVRSYSHSSGRLTHLDARQRMFSLWSRNGAVLVSAADRGTGYRNGWTIHFVQDSFLGFGFAGNAQAYSIQMPYWFPLAAVGIAGVAPWISRANRFSLRTLLIATTVVALALGTFIWLARR